MRFHLHVGGAGHFFVVGPTRAGKTTLINFFIVCWQRFSPCRTIVIDKDYSHWITLNSLGGQYVDLRPGSRSARMSPARWCNADKPEDFHKLRRWLEVTLCAFDSTPLQPFDIKVMDRSIEVLAAQAGERSLSALHMIISGQDQALAARLAPWIKGGRYGDLFDHETDTFSKSSKKWWTTGRLPSFICPKPGTCSRRPLSGIDSRTTSKPWASVQPWLASIPNPSRTSEMSRFPQP
jgi:type IV secretion system protein VirB4